jgi:hypothetical protein
MASVRERWRTIPGYPHYQASNLGRIRSLDTFILQKGRGGKLHRQKRKGRILRPVIKSNLRRQVVLSGKRTRIVARLVLLAWKGKPPKGFEANHKNGIPYDDCLKNLEWATRVQNQQHAIDTGLNKNVGATHYRATISEATARNILESKKTLSNCDAAKKFKTSISTVEGIRSRRTWKFL